MAEQLYPDVKPGAVVKVHQEIIDVTAKGEEKARIQIFEGLVLMRRHGSTPQATITVHKVSDGIGVEKIFPLSLPTIKKIEVVKQMKVRRAKVGFMKQTHKHTKEMK
jgi:large subunit ribosomal protein L19